MQKLILQVNSMKFFTKAIGTLALGFVFQSSFALNVAVFGSNGFDSFLNSNGHTATVYSDADIAAGLANGADIFVYNRDGASFGQDLSAAAEAQVLATFGSGNTTGIFTDITDDYTNANSSQLLLNSVNYSGNKGFLGLFNGAGWAIERGLLPGTSGGEGFNFNDSPATYNVTNAHPVTAGLASSWQSAQDSFISYSSGIPNGNVLARDNAGNVLVAVGAPVPEPMTMAALGLGLAMVARRRRKA